jgi:WD40 repeat protein
MTTPQMDEFRAELLREISLPKGVAGVQFADDLSRAMFGRFHWSYWTVIDLPGGQQRRIQERGGIVAADLSADGRQVATGSGRFVRIRDAATGQLRKRFAHTVSSDFWHVNEVIFSPDGRRLASRCYTWKVWDTATGAALCDLPKAFDPLVFPYGLGEREAFSPDGRWLIGRAGEAARLGIWDATTGELLRVLARGRVLAYDGRTLATVGADRTFAAWDAATGRQLLKFRPDTLPGPSRAALSPDGHKLAAPMGGGVMVWDVASGELLHRLPHVFTVRFSPSGGWLATRDFTEAVIWDVTTGQPIGRVPGRNIVQVRFGPEDPMLATVMKTPAAGKGFPPGNLQLWRLSRRT